MRRLNAHTLTLEFGRFLSQEEWHKVIRAINEHVPYVKRLNARAVALPTAEVAALHALPQPKASSRVLIQRQKKDEVFVPFPTGTDDE